MTNLVEKGSHLGGRVLRRAAIIPILLVSLPQSADTQEAVWTVDETPALSIGGEGSGPTSDMFGIRGAVRLEDGRIVVADRVQRLLVFDAEGTYLRTLGREGSGPGEFAAIMWLQRLPGDTLLMFDLRNNRRLSYFTADGGFARSVNSASSVGPRPMLMGALADGTLVATRGIFTQRRVTSNRVSPRRSQNELVRLDADGRVLNSLATLPGSEFLDGPGIPGLEFGAPEGPLRNTVFAIGARDIYAATGDRFEILVFSPEGGDPEVIRSEFEPIPFTRDDLIEFLESIGWGDRIPVGAIRDWPEDQTRPAILALRLDSAENLWAEEGREDPSAMGTWRVFDPSGRYIAKVRMPPRFRPFDIGTESVLGVWRDDLDVEYVQLRAIVKTNNQ